MKNKGSAAIKTGRRISILMICFLALSSSASESFVQSIVFHLKKYEKVSINNLDRTNTPPEANDFSSLDNKETIFQHKHNTKILSHTKEWAAQ